MPGSLKLRLVAARAADSAELEQAGLRIALVAVVGIYLLVVALWDQVLDESDLRLMTLIGFIFLLGFAHLGWILLLPGVSHLRRRAAVVLDIGSITAAMLASGEAGTVIYVCYLWVVIGNGFRFGRGYMHYAQALAVAGFLAVFLVDPLWDDLRALGATLLLALLVIPIYVSALLRKLHAASQRLEEARGSAEAANVAKSKFLAAASHDLRQPLQALSMYASVLEERVADASAQRVVHGIQLSVRALEQLFDSLLDISKIEAGVIKPNIVAFPLQPLIERAVEAERPMAAHKNLELRVAPTSASVLSDPPLLERMLKNLLANAVRYTERGRIVVGCRRVGRGRLRLQVADSGIGIPPQEQARIFEEYYQVAGASTQGLGLGLPIVKSLSDLLGHAVTVRSTPGRGSVFSIELERAAERGAAAEAAALPAAALGDATVVLVDDDAEIRESMRLLVESWGGRCITGASAADVETKLRAAGRAPDALIADYRLADALNGLQVIERLRAAFGATLPALLITGTSNLSALAREAGGIPLAVKPIAPGKLRAFLSRVPRP